MPDHSVLTAALRWIKRGAAPIPVPHASKAAILAGWQHVRIADEATARLNFDQQTNIAVVWGNSGSLIDVDIDHMTVRPFIDALLPPTTTFGRVGAPRTHRIYRSPGVKFRRYDVPRGVLPGIEGRILELLAEAHYSVVPPSTHPSGELYEWEDEAVRPTKIEARTLVRRLNLAAAGTVLAALWPERGRHELVLPLAGTMATSGYTLEEISELVLVICQITGDEQARDRLRAVEDTLRSFRAGKPITGLPTLAGAIGEGPLALLKTWLGLGAGPEIRTGGSVSSWASSEQEGELTVRAVSEVVERPVHWLWQNRFARGKLSMIAGKQGLSKSTLSCEVAAIVTRGDSWPLDGTRCEPGEVLMLNVEDDPEDTIRPRLRAAGAVLERVHLIEGVRKPDGKQRLVTLADVGILDQFLAKHPRRFVLLTVDPIGAFLAGRDSHKDGEIRELLAPLAALAQRYDVAVLLVAHLNKAAGMEAIYRVTGSVAFTAAVRALYFLVEDPDDKRLLLIPDKANNAPARMAGLVYRLESADFGGGIIAPRLRWLEAAELRSASEILRPPEREAPERAEAEQWLREWLKDGPVAVRELKDAASLEVNASWPTIERAARQIGAIGRGEKRARTWELPGQTEQTIKPSNHHHHESGGGDGKPSVEPQPSPLLTRDGDGLMVSAVFDGKPGAPAPDSSSSQLVFPWPIAPPADGADGLEPAPDADVL